MAESVIENFKKDFDMFWGLLEMQTARCPDDLWVKKAGGFLFWQQMLHAVAVAELFALPEGAPSLQTVYDRGVILLASVPETTMSKEDLHALAQSIQPVVHAFMERQTVASLGQKHAKLSAMFGKDITNQSAVTLLIAHLAYHVGACDAIFRDNGIPGVL